MYHENLLTTQQLQLICQSQNIVPPRRKLPPGAGPPSIHDEMDAKQPEQVLLDQNAIIKAAGSQFLGVGATSVSMNQNYAELFCHSACAP